MEFVERLTAAAERLEMAADKLAEQQAGTDAVGKIVATVDPAVEADLARRLEEAEAKIAELTAAAAVAAAAAAPAVVPARKTVSTLAKGNVAVDSMNAGAVDAALGSLSIEQRIAVKAELLRAGLL